MKKALNIILFISFCNVPLFSQKADDNMVYLKVLDTLNTNYKFDFYSKNLEHIDTKDYAENPTDSFTIIDSDSYEETTKLGIDLKIKFDSINHLEAKRFKQRLNYPNGVFVIGHLNEGSLHKNVDLKQYVKLESYPDIQLMHSLPEDILNTGKLGRYDILRTSKTDIALYKYAIKSYFYFSSIQWDTLHKYAIVECGFHCGKNNIRATGAGGLIILEKMGNTVKVIKMIGLWEE